MLAALFFLFNIPIPPVSAQDIASETASETQTQSLKTEIITDDEAGTVSIIIDGKTVGLFTKDGLHVPGDIVYGGTMRDAGGDVQKLIDGNDVSGGADGE